jgi:hypothetical protein
MIETLDAVIARFKRPKVERSADATLELGTPEPWNFASYPGDPVG